MAVSSPQLAPLRVHFRLFTPTHIFPLTLCVTAPRTPFTFSLKHLKELLKHADVYLVRVVESFGVAVRWSQVFISKHK